MKAQNIWDSELPDVINDVQLESLELKASTIISQVQAMEPKVTLARAGKSDLRTEGSDDEDLKDSSNRNKTQSLFPSSPTTKKGPFSKAANESMANTVGGKNPMGQISAIAEEQDPTGLRDSINTDS